MSDLILVIFSAAIINNIIVMEMLGADPALVFLRKLDIARGLSLTLLILLPLLTACGFMINSWVLVPNQVEYLQLLVYILLILCLSGLLTTFGHVVFKKSHTVLKIFLPYAAINTTVMGTLLLASEHSKNLLAAFGYGLGSAAGFALVLFMLTAINERLEAADVPTPFRGIPVLLLTLTLMSMGFMGFTGMVNL